MAHYVAELIHAAEASTDADRPAAESRAFDAILELWRHRNHLPDGHRPFETFEPLLASLERLRSDTPYYFRPDILQDPASQQLPEELKTWLRLVDSFDRTARILVNEALERAAELASGRSKDWVELVRGGAAPPGPDIDIVIELIDSLGSKTEGLRTRKREQLEQSLATLNHFLDGAMLFRDDIRLRLEQDAGSDEA